MIRQSVSDLFVSGALTSGRLTLVRQSGSVVRCEVVMCGGTLVDNGDGTADINFSGGE